jgi:hypothetical protein
MAEPRDWPIEQPPSLRPWFLSAMGHLSATGHLAILFKTRADAQRAQQSLHARGVPGSDVRLYTSEQILDTCELPSARSPCWNRATLIVSVDVPGLLSPHPPDATTRHHACAERADGTPGERRS